MLSRLLKLGFAAALAAGFAWAGIAAVNEKRWDAVTLGIVLLIFSANCLYHVIFNCRALARRA